MSGVLGEPPALETDQVTCVFNVNQGFMKG